MAKVPAPEVIELRVSNEPMITDCVVFNHPGSADGLHPRKQSPAIVQRVNDDGTLELFVMSVYGGVFFSHNVVHDAASPSCWCWPEESWRYIGGAGDTTLYGARP